MARDIEGFVKPQELLSLFLGFHPARVARVVVLEFPRVDDAKKKELAAARAALENEGKKAQK